MADSIIKGFTKTSMLDYPGKIVSVIFTAGCSFRCGFCHNPELVNNDERLIPFEEEKVLDYLEGRKNWLDGVCITGGEPTLEKELPTLMKKIKKIGLMIKLDTNGTNPKMLKEIIDEKLADYLAMDIKTSKEKYEKACGVKVDMKKIQESIDLIKESGIDYEFRTTAVPTLVDTEDIREISEWIGDVNIFAIQQFVPIKTLDEKYSEIHHYHIPVLNEMAEIARKKIKNVEVRA